MKEHLKEIIIRDLGKLRSEIESYSNEKNLWITSGDIKNSAGNLCLHINGGLKHFIGAVLGNNGYVRNREIEFTLKNIPREELLKSTDETIEMIIQTMDSIHESFLTEKYPVPFLDKIVTKGYIFIHLATHLNYHLGQINYHRRLLDK
ncbi:MAG: DinB family protein [Ignavibacteriales bacterium]|nr:MAG: DinB family protein [Ignavibacteriales bacterium]